MNTTENNKILAVFMELPFISEDGKTNYIKDLRHISDWKLKYHSDWNWLIQVVEKIEDIENFRFDFQINQHTVRIFDHIKKTFIFEINSTSKIEAVYFACIDFVKWYNEN